jgi:hypothetical protein
MLHNDSRLSMHHIPDHELVCWADGELSPQHAAEVEAHLEACWECRPHMEEIQSTITDFVCAHHSEFDGQLPLTAGPRALLRARLAQLGSEQRTERWRRVLQFGFALPRVAVAGFPLIAIAIGILWFRHGTEPESSSTTALFDTGAAPNRTLTPGATRLYGQNCGCACGDSCCIPLRSCCKNFRCGSSNVGSRNIGRQLAEKFPPNSFRLLENANNRRAMPAGWRGNDLTFY